MARKPGADSRGHAHAIGVPLAVHGVVRAALRPHRHQRGPAHGDRAHDLGRCPGCEPVSEPQPGETLVGLQLLLIAAVLPHFVLAAAIEERRQASSALAARLRFEELLSHLSQAFVHVPSNRMDESFDTWIRRVGEALHIDGLMLFRRSDDSADLVLRSVWMRPVGDATPVINPGQEFPWATAEVLANREVVVESVEDMPSDAVRDRRAFEDHGFAAGLGLPLVAGDQVLGCLAYVSMVERMRWAPDLVARLRLVAQIFGNAMARQRSEDTLRASEELKSAILGSLMSGVAVLDRTGLIITVNERWRGLECDSGLPWACLSVGDNLVEECHRVAVHDDRAKRAFEGIRAVLGGQSPQFVIQHSSGSIAGTRYWVLTVRPLHHAAGGAVVTHAEITERKRAELEAQAARAELAHMSRVSTMGELTASLAHELNQPLAAIIANAQAARRLLAQPDRSFEELPLVLRDIVDDGLRAGAVIRRTREMLRKEGPSLERLDLGTLVREVAGLVTNDALIRNVTIQLSLPAAPAFVDGDRIQLQQVILNLLMNALEAVGDDPANARMIQVRASSAEGQTVHVEVRDSGPGVVAPVDRVFDPFYTTKATGMGMGLSIARSIVEAHGGSIRVSNNDAGGVTAGFRLPLALEKRV